MAMLIDNGAGRKADINMTPMIDVLLVLIIIFMVITPLAPNGFQTLVPQPPPPEQVPVERRRDIVITVGIDGSLSLNGESLDFEHLPARLSAVYRARGDEVTFVRGQRGLSFGQVAEVIDIAYGAGLHRVALITTVKELTPTSPLAQRAPV
jgi:biopolymer transport protein ExbD